MKCGWVQEEKVGGGSLREELWTSIDNCEDKARIEIQSMTRVYQERIVGRCR